MGDAEIRKHFEDQFSIFLTDTPVMASKFPAADMGKWITAVMADLASISGTRIGALLLRSIRKYGQVVWITPIEPGLGCQGQTGEEDQTAHTDAMILYNPLVQGVGSACGKRSQSFGGYANLSFQVLFHELVHALRYVSGKNKKDVVPGKGLSFYTNKEEFIAVLVEGIFASGLKRPIRSNHAFHTELEPERNGSYLFYRTGTETYQVVKDFCGENRNFTSSLACIDVPFNPIKAFYDKPALAKSISQNSPLAKYRDFVNANVYQIYEFAKDVIQQTLSDQQVAKANAGLPPTSVGRTPRYMPDGSIQYFDPKTGRTGP